MLASNKHRALPRTGRQWYLWVVMSLGDGSPECVVIAGNATMTDRNTGLTANRRPAGDEQPRKEHTLGCPGAGHRPAISARLTA